MQGRNCQPTRLVSSTRLGRTSEHALNMVQLGFHAKDSTLLIGRDTLVEEGVNVDARRNGESDGGSRSDRRSGDRLSAPYTAPRRSGAAGERRITLGERLHGWETIRYIQFALGQLRVGSRHADRTLREPAQRGRPLGDQVHVAGQLLSQLVEQLVELEKPAFAAATIEIVGD